jgi:hypothetical protein
MRLEDESGHAEGGSGGTSDVHGGSSTGELRRLGGRGTSAVGSAGTVGGGDSGGGAVVVNGSRDVRSRGSGSGGNGSN